MRQGSSWRRVFGGESVCGLPHGCISAMTHTPATTPELGVSLAWLQCYPRVGGLVRLVAGPPFGPHPFDGVVVVPSSAVRRVSAVMAALGPLLGCKISGL